MFKRYMLAIGLLMASAVASQATTVTLTFGGGYVSGSSSFNHRIDLSAILADYRIIGGNLNVHVRDDHDATQTTYGAYGNYTFDRRSSSGLITYYNYERNRAVMSTRDGERAELMVFGGRYDSVSSYGRILRYRTATNRTCYLFEWSSTEGRCDRDYDNFTGFYSDLGSMTLSATINSFLAAQLESDGFLDVGVRAGQGDFDVTGGSLTLQLEALPTMAPVPLPAGALLLASALGLGALARRRQTGPGGHRPGGRS